MKKTFKFIIAIVAIVAVAAIVFVGCAGGNKGNNTLTLNKTSDVLSMSVVSSANILSGIASGAVTAPKIANAAEVVTTASKDVTDAEIEEIHKQIQIFETFIGSDPINVKSEVSEKVEFVNKITMTLKDITGKSATYILYYNETIVGGVATVSDNDKNHDEDTDDVDDDDDVNEMDSEQEFTLTGIMIFDEKEYQIVGEKELEDGEYEMNIKASIDEKNYILISQEVEGGEIELSYQIWTDGVKSSTFALELENENGDVSVKMKSVEDGQKVVRTFSKETEKNKTFIKIHQMEGKRQYMAKVMITVDPTTGEEVYKYMMPNGKTFDKK